MTTKTTTGRTTKPKQAVSKDKAKNTTNKATVSKAKPIKDIKAKQVIKDSIKAKPQGEKKLIEPIEDTNTGIIKAPGKGNPQAYKNSPFVGNNAITATDKDMAQYWDNALTVYNWPKIDMDSNEEVEDRCGLYLEHCRARGERPTVEGLSVAIGISPRTLQDWENGVTRAQVDNTRPLIIKKAKALIQYMLAQMAMGNKIYPNVWIFYGKNWFGMKDIQEVNITANNSLGDKLTQADILARLPQDIPIDTTYTEQ